MAAKPDQAYEYHPLAKKFPRMAPNVFKAFCADIKERGLDKPIELLDGMIFDGRHRYEACLNEGVEPKFIELGEGTDADSYVRAVNALRRHMTQDELADWIVARRNGENTEKNGDSKGGGDKVPTPPSNRQLSKETGIDRKVIDRADAIAKKAIPEVKAAVDSGVVTRRDAAAVANKSPEVQRRAMEKLVSGKAETLRGAVKGGGGKTRKSRTDLFVPWTQLFSRITKDLDKLNDRVPGGKFYKQAEAGFEAAARALRDWRDVTR